MKVNCHWRSLIYDSGAQTRSIECWSKKFQYLNFTSTLNHRDSNASWLIRPDRFSTRLDASPSSTLLITVSDYIAQEGCWFSTRIGSEWITPSAAGSSHEELLASQVQSHYSEIYSIADSTAITEWTTFENGSFLHHPGRWHSIHCWITWLGQTLSGDTWPCIWLESLRGRGRCCCSEYCILRSIRGSREG